MLFSVRVALLVLFSSVVHAQSQPLATAASANDSVRAGGEPVSAVVTFTLDFPKSQPEHYSIRIPAAGPGHYQSTGRISADSEETDTFDFDFAVSNEMREKMFQLAASARYFQHDLDSHQKNLAFTGKKTLTYKDGSKEGESTFNYAAEPAARELTGLFQDLSATLEFGHRLDYDHRYQKLALDDELKRMQEMTQGKALIEVAAIQPILERIVADHSVMNVARARAQQLLGGANSR
jgi:hypothetical protein